MRLVLTCQILCGFCLTSFCGASSWSNWSACSATCGEGKMSRRRSCDVFELGCNNGEYVDQSKPCSLTPCGGLHCFEGISASVGGFETINTFSLRECGDIIHAPASRDPNGRAGLLCATIIMKVERNGMKFDMIQGTCLNEDLCGEVNCNRYKKLMGLHNIESCEVRCCGKDRCNDPALHKAKKDEAVDADPCSENPCQNSGSCIAIKSDNAGYICACRPGFTGQNCTEDSHTICHTGVSTRTAAVPVATEMLTTTCESPSDKCMVASMASYVGGIPMYVDTAQCVKADVCDRLKCSDLKKTTNQYEIASCKIYCCSDDYCNNVPTKMPPLPTTTSYSPGTVRATKRTTTKKPRPARRTTRKPATRRITPRTTATTTTQSTTVDTSGPHWSKWQKWQTCTHACGDSGTRRRYRYCMKGAPGMPGCMPQDADHEIVPCNTGVSCIRWREWGNWQTCSQTCGGGKRERRRSCDGGAPNTGDCIGSDMEQEDCKVQSCTTTKPPTTTRPPTTTKRNTPRWSKWTEWNTCSQRCGLGTQQRRRVCIGGRIGRRGCRGKVKQTQDCNEGPCTTATTTTATTAKKPRGWGIWTDWSSCSVSCGKGTETRTRECHGTKPGKKGCRGKKKDIRTCQSSCPEPTPATPEAKCFDRNAAKARKAGRKCPPKCAMQKDCQRKKKCVCDGLCGKTCQIPSKRCSDIASQKKKPGTKIACSAGYSVGSVCTFSCEKGYKLKGNPAVICQGTSKWTNEKNLPTCTASTTSPTTSSPTCEKKRQSHNACCGKRSYNSRSAKCCKGRVSPGGKAATKCCASRPYDPKRRGCCTNKVFWISRQKCKNGRVVKK